MILIITMLISLFVIYASASSSLNNQISTGEGGEVISGWRVSNVSYELANDPHKVGSIAFDLDSPAHRVYVAFNGQQARAYPCTLQFGNHWQCHLFDVKIAEIDQLNVIASGR